MARIVQNDKGFKVIALSHEDGELLGWGIRTKNEEDTDDQYHFLCMQCNHDIKGELYYVAVLNDVMDEECYNRWYEDAIHYSDDMFIEDRNFNYCKLTLQLLGRLW